MCQLRHQQHLAPPRRSGWYQRRQFMLGTIPAWLAIRKLGALKDGTMIHAQRTYATEEDRRELRVARLRAADHDPKEDL